MGGNREIGSNKKKRFGVVLVAYKGGQKEMRKVIKISGKEYSMKSSAYTQFKYKDVTGNRMLDDIQKISKINGLSEEEQVGRLDDVIELLLKMAYIMIEEADDKQVTTFEDFLKNIDGLFEDTTWINEVIELATSPISRGIQNLSPNKQ